MKRILIILGLILFSSLSVLQATLVVESPNISHRSNINEFYDIDIIKLHAKSVASIILFLELNAELEDNPNGVETVARDKNIDLDINAIQENSKQLLEKLRSTEPIFSELSEEHVRKIARNLYQIAVSEECLNYGIEIDLQSDSDLYQLLIECTLKAYDAGLVAAAEEAYSKLLAEEDVKKEL